MIASVVSKLISVGFFKYAPILLAAAGGEGHGEHGSGPPHLPNLFSLLYNWGLLPESVYHFASEWINVIYGAFTAIIMSIIAMRIYAKRQMAAHIILRLGSLDNDPGAQEKCHIWVSQKAPWYSINSVLPEYQKGE